LDTRRNAAKRVGQLLDVGSRAAESKKLLARETQDFGHDARQRVPIPRFEALDLVSRARNTH
jgi:hypothetical protein